MGKGKYKNKNKNKNKNRSENISKNKNRSKNTNYQPKQKKAQTVQSNNSNKFKLQIMDIITIIFTAIIIGLMIFVIYNQFSDSKKPNDSASSTTNAPSSDSTAAAATATPAPTLSDIGNIYGNITNEANVVEINEREYFISNDDENKPHIYVNIDNDVKDLIQTDASSLSVITDYLAYTDQKDVKSYYVFYINSEGSICYVKDEPIGNGLAEPTGVKEEILVEGNFTSIDVSGEFVYHLDAAGKLGKTSIEKKETTTFTTKKEYSDFILYYGTIYAKCIDDNFIYSIPTNASSLTETCIVSTACDKFVIDNDLIYITTKDGILRYSTSSANLKETILKEKNIESINVYKNAIFYITDGELYTCSAESLIYGEEPVKICKTDSETINVSANSIYLLEEDNSLYKVSYDPEKKTYSDPVKMN